MKIEKTGLTQRDPRSAYPKPAKVRAGGREAEGTVKDISTSGVALILHGPLDASQFENREFVELQIEGLGQFRGSVVRAYDDGVAVRFEADDEDRKAIDEGVAKFNRLA